MVDRPSLAQPWCPGVSLGSLQITNQWFVILVGGLEHILFSHILGIIIPIDFHIFQGGWNHKPGYPHVIILPLFNLHLLRNHGASAKRPASAKARWKVETRENGPNWSCFPPQSHRVGACRFHRWPAGFLFFRFSLRVNTLQNCQKAMRSSKLLGETYHW